MKLRVNVNTAKFLLLIALMLYSLSQQSWVGLISGNIMWRILFLGCLVFGITALLKMKKKPSLYILLNIAMMIIVLTFNNQNLSNGSNGYELVFCEIILFAISSYKDYYWINNALKVMLVLGCFYAFMTLASFLSKGFYDAVVYPFISSINDISHMGLSSYYSNGFTAHYSFNGMYVAMAVCVAIGILVPTDHHSKVNKKALKVAFVILMFLALLFTNKRAHILFTGVGAFLAYYFYNCNIPVKRITKIFALLIGIILAGYFLSYFMPDAFDFLQRFQESSKGEGGISNGRFSVWAKAITFSNGKLWFGTGWWSFYRYFGAHVHNIYLQLLVETGVVGAIVFFTFFISSYIKNIILIIRSRKNRTVLPTGAERYLIVSLVYQTFFLLYGITGTCLYEIPTLVPYMMFTAITEHYWVYKKNDIEEKA